MTLKLAQQYETDQRFSRIVGGQPVEFQISREDLQGEFDISLRFNTDTLNPERMEQKATMFQTVIAPLAGGTIDTGAFVRGMAEYFFPEFAEDMIRSGPQADQAELKDEQDNWTKMMAGTEPEMAESGQNFQLRLDWLNRQLAQPGSQKRLAANEDSAELVTKRLQHLQFQVDQQTVNKAAGAKGALPGPTAV